MSQGKLILNTARYNLTASPTSYSAPSTWCPQPPKCLIWKPRSYPQILHLPHVLTVNHMGSSWPHQHTTQTIQVACLMAPGSPRIPQTSGPRVGSRSSHQSIATPCQARLKLRLLPLPHARCCRHAQQISVPRTYMLPFSFGLSYTLSSAWNPPCSPLGSEEASLLLVSLPVS